MPSTHTGGLTKLSEGIVPKLCDIFQVLIEAKCCITVQTLYTRLLNVHVKNVKGGGQYQLEMQDTGKKYHLCRSHTGATFWGGSVTD